MCEDCRKRAEELEEAARSIGHTLGCTSDRGIVQFICSCGWKSHTYPENSEDPELGPESLYREWARHVKKLLCKN